MLLSRLLAAIRQDLGEFNHVKAKVGFRIEEKSLPHISALAFYSDLADALHTLPLSGTNKAKPDHKNEMLEKLKACESRWTRSSLCTEAATDLIWCLCSVNGTKGGPVENQPA
jgi:hypothetical protein